MAEQRQFRCAIYTRVSTDSGLEQDFNSLDAQREAAEAYIKSQAHEGWRQIHEPYDDGGFSGGSLERPGLRRLLEDLKAGKVDIIVVYKVDRLTRSLADFAKLVELFDQYKASFVSVTQAFNTTSSMGRLTLNVLLSFAQFEREVTAERIRDKVAASKKKGIWMGGVPPLGYCVKDRKLMVDPTEAEIVRRIFRRYLELGSLLPLLEELHRTGVRTRLRQLSSGKSIGGVSLTRGALSHLLRNRTYLGELNHHDRSYPGEHDAIIELDIFNSAQSLLTQNAQTFRNARSDSGSWLAKKLFDDRGNLLTPTHTLKGGVRYRYYICRLLIEGRRAEAGPIERIPAAPLEAAVADAVRTALRADARAQDMPLDSLANCLQKVVVFPGHFRLWMQAPESSEVIEIKSEWAWRRGRPKRELILAHTDSVKDARPIKSETRVAVVGALAMGRKWLKELLRDPDLTIEAIAARDGRSTRSVRMLLSLSFLSPQIVRSLISGKLPRGVGITKLVHLPSDWTRQCEVLRLNGEGIAHS